ncbi:hypothetical protein LG3211_0552 [Lysobacter gummosus]|nr:hypothetical protein LG3211_0552 [Lysobacter gummosus]
MLQGGQGRPRPGRTRPRCVCGCAIVLWEGVAVGGSFSPDAFRSAAAEP